MNETPMFKFNLPTLQPEFCKYLIEHTESLYDAKKDEKEFQRWHRPPFADDPFNIGHFLTFDFEHPVIDSIFAALPWKMLTTLTIIKNTDPSRVAQVLPHIDRSRKVALIYYVTTGGPDVHTTFIHATEEQKKRKIIEGHDFDVYGSGIANQDEWHIFKADDFHGVTNVENSRIMVSCQTEDRSVTWEQFVEATKHLLI